MRYDELSPDERARLRAAYDAGWSAGGCVPSRVPDELIALIDAVQDDWISSLEVVQAQARARSAFPEIEWLRAACERRAALGDAQPPDGWIRASAQDGRP